MRHCDVLICGAGISGLLLAAELSRHFSVVVLERNPRSACSRKFWLTTKRSLEPNAELRPFVDSEWGEMDFIASSGSKFTAKGAYILWDTKRLESHLVDRTTKNGSSILYDSRFYSYRTTKERIIARYNNESICAALLIDCMGFASPIIRASRAVNILGYHHVYGKVLRLKREIAPVAADNVILSDAISFFEVFPRRDGNANAVVIAPVGANRSARTLAQDFNFIVQKSHYSDILEQIPGGEPLQGVVPVGVVRSAALDRILFFGEAGQLHPAATGTCMTRLLLQYKSVAQAVAQKVRSNQLEAHQLRTVARHLGSFAAKFHQCMFMEQIQATSSHGESFVELLHCLDHDSINDFIFGDLKPSHFLQMRNLARLLQRKNFIWLRPLLRTLIS